MDEITQPPSPKCIRRKRPHGGTYCCVPGCFNNFAKDKITGVKRSYYGFPRLEPKRTKLWVALIRRKSNWIPKNHSKVCAVHFVGGKKSNNPSDPGYLPTLFPHRQKPVKKRKTLNSSKTVLTPSQPVKKRKRKAEVHPVSSTTSANKLNGKSEMKTISPSPVKKQMQRAEISTVSSPLPGKQQMLRTETGQIPSALPSKQHMLRAEISSGVLPLCRSQQMLKADKQPDKNNTKTLPVVTFPKGVTVSSQRYVSLLPPHLRNNGKNSNSPPVVVTENQASESISEVSTPASKSLHVDHNYLTLVPVSVQNSKENLKLMEQTRTIRKDSEKLVSVQYSKEYLELKEESEILRKENERLRKKVFGSEMCKDNDPVLRYYTNLPTYDHFTTLSRYLHERCSGNLKYWNGSETSKHVHFTAINSKHKKPGKERQLSFEDELFLVLVKFKCQLDNKDLRFRFGISESTVSRTLTTWTSFLKDEFTLLNELPSDELADTQIEVKSLLKRVFSKKKKAVPKSKPQQNGDEKDILRNPDVVSPI